MRTYKCLRVVIVMVLALATFSPLTPVSPLSTTATPASAQTNTRCFSETGYCISGAFLTYWNTHGAVALLGYPLTEVFLAQSPYNGQNYLMQYFERAIFEWHPENRSPYNVLLGPLGVLRYNQLYPYGAPNQTPWNLPGTKVSHETGKTLGGIFLQYWEQYGGLLQFGHPISDPFYEQSRVDGNGYWVQYFERTIFEHHPQYAGTAYEVQLSPLGWYALCDYYSCPQVQQPGSTTGTSVTLPNLSNKYNQTTGAQLLRTGSRLYSVMNNIVRVNPAAGRVITMAKNLTSCGESTNVFNIGLYESKSDWTAAGVVAIISTRQLKQDPVSFIACVITGGAVGGGGASARGGPIDIGGNAWITKDGAYIIAYGYTQTQVGYDFCSVLRDCPSR